MAMGQFASLPGEEKPHYILGPIKPGLPEALVVARYNTGLLARVLANTIDDRFDQAMLTLLIEAHRLRQGRGSAEAFARAAQRLSDSARPPRFEIIDLPDTAEDDWDDSWLKSSNF